MATRSPNERRTVTDSSPDFGLPIALGDRRGNLLAKALELGAAQLKRFQLRTGDRIDGLAVNLQLKVQVRPCRAASTAHEADKLAAHDLLAGLDAGSEGHQMTVDGRELLSVLDANPIAVAPVGLRADHHAITRGVNRCPGLCHKI